jgi:hypothetical protein
VKGIPYTFTVIRYVHDRAAGETLNVGVIVLAPDVEFIGVEVETRFERLSRVFSGFDGDVYRQTLVRLKESVSRLRPRLGELRGFTSLPSTATALIREIWPDVGSSFTTGSLLAGVSTEAMESVTSDLFRRMVTSQTPLRSDAERRSDEEVWSGTYQAPLREAKVSHRLVEHTFAGPDFRIRFDHAFQNRRWHVVQPVTMDFVREESLQEKATRWLGTATALKDHTQLAKLHLLLGEPHLESHRQAYDKAKNLLHKMPVDHELIEERDAEAFARELAEYIRQQG